MSLYLAKVTAAADSSTFRRYAELNARAISYVKGSEESHLLLEKEVKDKIFLHTTAFAHSPKMRDAALALYVNAKVGLVHCSMHHLLRESLPPCSPRIPSTTTSLLYCTADIYH